jgi:hypothetical protein
MPVDRWDGTPGTRITGDVPRTDQDQRLPGDVSVGEVLRNAAWVRRGDAHVATSPHHRNDQEVCLTRQRQAREAMRGMWGGDMTDIAVSSVRRTIAQMAAGLAARSAQRRLLVIGLLACLLSVCCLGCGMGRPPVLTLDQWEEQDRRTRSTGG